jgi:hypothetical protein
MEKRKLMQGKRVRKAVRPRREEYPAGDYCRMEMGNRNRRFSVRKEDRGRGP